MDTITQMPKRQVNKALWGIILLIIICLILSWALGFFAPITTQFSKLSFYFQPQHITIPTPSPQPQANKEITKSLAHATYVNIPATDLAIKIPNTTYHTHQLIHDSFLKIQTADVAFRDDYQQTLFDTQDCIKKVYAQTAVKKEAALNQQFCNKLLSNMTPTLTPMAPSHIAYEIDIISTTTTPENFIHANYIPQGQTNPNQFPVGKLVSIGTWRLLRYTFNQNETIFFLPYANKHNQAVLILFRGDTNILTSFLPTIKQNK